MKTEIWRPVAGYEGLYEVSNLGRVRSLARRLKNGHFWVEKILVPTFSNYMRVQLCKDGISKRHLVHRLVARAFPEICGRWFEGCVVHHMDCNPRNNAASNLKVCTQAYNCNYEPSKKLMIEHQHSIAINQLKDGVLINTYKSIGEAVRAKVGHYANISKCLRGERETANGYQWKYA